jgi:uncharacterized protein YecE (DUF72 family)
VRSGTAGWAIPRPVGEMFPGEGTHLQRYARALSCVEINSCFYRPHAAKTYAKWAASTPADFRFSVKMPKLITHTLKLRDAAEPLAQFLEETASLGEKRGPLLVQLPPSLAFAPDLVAPFFDLLRAQYQGDVVCEPRHPSWSGPDGDADALLAGHRVARVAADPPPFAGADRPGAWPGIIYVRLHGSPHMYWSRYSVEYIRELADRLTTWDAPEVWCIFDNTAAGAAIENAMELMKFCPVGP